MDKSIEKIIKEILELPHEMRAYLAEKLIESLDTESDFEISEEWKKEIEYRCDQIDKGNAVLRDADEVFKSAYEDLK
jgi:putative addiction module component (TIGR02574 family)